MNNFFENVQNDIISDKNIYVGTVIKIDKQYLDGTISVRIDGLDDKLSDNELYDVKPAFAHGFIWYYPKVGEQVLIAVNQKNNNSQRFWLGIINQKPDSLDYSTNNNTNTLTNNKNAIGVFPNYTDVVIHGRDNTDIKLSDKNEGEILIRSGRHTDKSNEFNSINPSFIQLKKNSQIKEVESFKKEKSTFFVPPIHLFYITKDIDYKLTVKKDDNIIFLFDSNDVVEFKTKIQEKKKDFIKWQIITELIEFKDWQRFYNGYKVTKNVVYSKKVINTDKKSIINLAADKIYLLSHKTVKNITDNNDLIDNKRQFELDSELESIPKGESLTMLLDLIIKVIVNHTHPFDNLSTTQDTLVKKLLSFDLNTILNTNIKTG